MSFYNGAIAQLGERLLCKQEVGGSIPPGSTIKLLIKNNSFWFILYQWLYAIIAIFNNLNLV